MHTNTALPPGVYAPTTGARWRSIACDPDIDWSPIGLDYLTENYPDERWRDHPDYPLRVSDHGRVWGSSYHARYWFKRQHFSHSGSLFISSSHSGVTEKFAVTRLVWETFRGPVPEGRNIRTITGLSWDNRLKSLAAYSPANTP